jgi:hypothetical protein
LAKVELAVVGNREHAVKYQFAAGSCVLAEIDFQSLTFFNFVLVSTVCDDCVHDYCSGTIRGTN